MSASGLRGATPGRGGGGRRRRSRSRGGGGADANPPFAGDISAVSFFYMDKFLMLACGRSLYMYSYLLDSLEVAWHHRV